MLRKISNTARKCKNSLQLIDAIPESQKLSCGLFDYNGSLLVTVNL
jgi:hypothetical protein